MTDLFQSLAIIALAITSFMQMRTINRMAKDLYGGP